MARFGIEDADNYGNGGSSSFFSLRDDGDVARVRFLYNDINDVTGLAVHEIELDGKKRYVNCLRSYNDPKSVCPLCAANNFQKAKLYIPLYDEDEQKVKYWERGKNFFKKLSGLCSRYANSGTPLCARVFDIERHGKKGDTGTEYEIYPTDIKDNKTLEDFDEVQDVVGTIVLDKTADEMQDFLNTGKFSDVPANARRGGNDDMPVRRTPSRRTDDTF